MTPIAEDALEAPNEETLQAASQQGSPDEPIRYRCEEFWSRIFYSAILSAAAVAGFVMLVMWL